MLRARVKLFAALPVKCDAIFRAIEFECCLPEQILILTKLRIEFVGTRAQAFRFCFQRRPFCVLRFGRRRFQQQRAKPLRLCVEFQRLARHYLPQQAAHFLAQLRVTPRL